MMGILSVLFYVAGVALSLGGVNAIVNYGESDPAAIAGMFLVPLILLVLGFACGKMKKAKVVDNLLDKAKSLTEKKEGVEIIKAEKFKSYSVADEL
ncbi:MAG: hypothetical protein GY861_13415, partial [bacterium]|nr:hypothetical protein [bacterium]